MKLRVFVLSMIVFAVGLPALRTAPNTLAASVLRQTSETANFACAGVSEIPLAECDALVALYNSTDGPNWSNHTHWLVTAAPCADWFGVECNEGHVDVLLLAANRLNGVIPGAVADLTRLEHLDLSMNQLSGGIPPELANLTNLLILNLSSNQLSGGIASELGNLPSLEQLDLASNQLSGPLPLTLGNLPLFYFNFADTALCIPPDGDFQAWLAGIEELQSTNRTCGASFLFLPALQEQ
jgi:hypothetical protein